MRTTEISSIHTRDFLKRGEILLIVFSGADFHATIFHIDNEVVIAQVLIIVQFVIHQIFALDLER